MAVDGVIGCDCIVRLDRIAVIVVRVITIKGILGSIVAIGRIVATRCVIAIGSSGSSGSGGSVVGCRVVGLGVVAIDNSYRPGVVNHASDTTVRYSRTTYTGVAYRSRVCSRVTGTNRVGLRSW